MRRSAWISWLAGALAVLGLSGCSDLRDLPLPGLVSGPTFAVTAYFPSALGLPEQAGVRYHGAVVGEVAAVRTEDYVAVVDLELSERVGVPSAVRAEIRFSSPLGEAFVELTDPPPAKNGDLPDLLVPGSVIELAQTSSAPSVTDLLASVSTLVTGGSFADMKVIITELNTALTGNSGNVRGLVRRLDQTLTRLNGRTADFDQALTSISRLASALAQDRELIGEALSALDPAIRTLSQQREQILALMRQVRALSRVGTTTITQVQDDLTAVLGDLGPVLDTLTRNERYFQPIFDGIRDFGRQSEAATYGLFTNFDLTILIKPDDLINLPGRSVPSSKDQQP